MQRPSGSGLHRDLVLAGTGPVALLGLFDGDCEALVLGSWSDTDGLPVDEASVPLGVLVGQVERVCGERLGAAALLQKIGGVVAGDGPSDVGRHFDG